MMDLRVDVRMSSTASDAAEGEWHAIRPRLHGARRDLPGDLRLLVQAAVDRGAGTSRPARVAHPRVRDAAGADGDQHGHSAPQRRVRLLSEFLEAEFRERLLA